MAGGPDGDSATTFCGWEHGGGVHSRGRGGLGGELVMIVLDVNAPAVLESGVMFCIVKWNLGGDVLGWSRRVLFVGPRSKLRQ